MSVWSRQIDVPAQLKCRTSPSAHRRNKGLKLISLEDRTNPAVDITAFDAAAGTVTFTGDLDGTTADALVLSEVTVDGQVLLATNLGSIGGTGIYASSTDLDPSAGVANLVIGAGTSPLITVALGEGNDTLTVPAEWSFDQAVQFDAGAGVDSLISVGSRADEFNITGAASGTLNSTFTFAGVEKLNGKGGADVFDVRANFAGNIRGGGGNDRFVIHAGGSIAGTVSGNGGIDLLDLSESTTATTVTLTGASTAGFSGTSGLTGGFSGINEIIGTQAGDRLVGLNQGALWTLDADPTLATGGLTLRFDGFETLQGGSASDDFRILTDQTVDLLGGAGGDSFEFADADAALTGSIDGEGGVDTISFAELDVDVKVDLEAGVATNVSGSISDIENATGGAGDDILIGDDADNRLAGGAGTDIVVGNGGNDVLRGGQGRDIVIGGAGADVVRGGGGEDILIGGSTTMDGNEAELNALLDSWTPADVDYKDRVHDLQQLLKDIVIDDNITDLITGGGADDLFVVGKKDAILDRSGGERKIQVN